MIEKIIVIVIIAIAVCGMVLTIYREQRKSTPCDGGCTTCPLANKCTEKN